MRTNTPWKPNESGLPDPFFMAPRDYLDALNNVRNDADLKAAERMPSVWLQEEPIENHYDGPYLYHDPDTFHPTGGWAVPIKERHALRKAS